MSRFRVIFEHILTAQRYLSTAGIFVIVLATSILLGEIVYNKWELVFNAIHIFLVVTVFFLGLIVLAYLKYMERRRGLKQMLSWVAATVMAMNVAALLDSRNPEYGQFLVGFGGAVVIIIIFVYVARHHPEDAFTMFLFGKPESYKKNEDVTKR